MQRVAFVLLTVGGLLSCQTAEEEPLCAAADEVLVFEDADQDGFGARAIGYRCELLEGQSTNNVDCDDSDPLVFPGQQEICDNVDNNCNGGIDENFNPRDYYLDNDGDSYGDPESLLRTCENPGAAYVLDNTDCDDQNIGVSPGATEVCDNDLDDDCNGTIDDRFEKECDDYKDGDCDGDIDCADDDCASSPSCRLPCTDIIITDTSLPVVFAGSTVDPLPTGSEPTDDFLPNFFCAPVSTAPDVVLQWRVPETGYYSFSTMGSNFDTVLSIYVNQCSASQDCNNDDEMNDVSTSRLFRALGEGTLVALVIDGDGAAAGDFVLTIDQL